jgi:hypothetical protein
MTLRPILSDSLPLSTFEDTYSIFEYTCLYLYYSPKQSILDINLKFFQIKSPSAIAKGLEMVRLPRQNDFRTFCMSDETEKVYRKLEEIIGTCWEFKKGRSLN